MSPIKWSGGDDDRQALVKRARNLLAENKEPIGEKEIVRTDLARRAGVTGNRIEPQKETPTPLTRRISSPVVPQIEAPPPRELIRKPKTPYTIELYPQPVTRERPAATFQRTDWRDIKPSYSDDHTPPADLPRICAVTGKLWGARYLRELDPKTGKLSYRYIRSVPVDARMCEMYYTQWRSMPEDFITGIEDCPHCGAYTRESSRGSVWCGDCQSWCCYGLTSRTGFFTCFCGSRGQLVKSNQTQIGALHP